MPLKHEGLRAMSGKVVSGQGVGIWLPRGKRNRKTGEVVTTGRISHEEMQAWLRARGVMLHGGDLDEAPQAYRRLPEVLACHEGTVKVEHTLRWQEIPETEDEMPNTAPRPRKLR